MTQAPYTTEKAYLSELKNALKAEGIESLIKIGFSFEGISYKIKPVLIKGNTLLQTVYTAENRCYTQNLSEQEAYDFITQRVGIGSSLCAIYEKFTLDFKVSKKGKLLTNKYKNDCTLQDKNHDQAKKRLITLSAPLIDLGVMTEKGEVKKHLFDKYIAVEKFIQIIEDVTKNKKSCNIIDFGCGKSYLSFVVYEYLQNKGIDVSLTGMDLKADVIEKCNALAKKYKYEKLRFIAGDIKDYDSPEPVDLMVCLHACDTATDYALLNAVRLNASAILAVPCCQHEINLTIKDGGLMTRYGIVKERFSALITDAVRANVLTYLGYKTQMLEFVDFDRTPKNIMIKAVKAQIPQEAREAALQEVKQILQQYDIDQTFFKKAYQEGKLTPINKKS